MTIRIVVPEMGESVLEATVIDWLKDEGDYVRAGEVLVELETDKVNVEVGAQDSGILERIAAEAGQDVRVGDLLGEIETDAAEPETAAGPQTAETRSGDEKKQAPAPAAEEQAAARPQANASRPESAGSPPDGGEAVKDSTAGDRRATPVAARLAKDRDVDLADIDGSGPGGRVTKSDVQSFLEQKPEVETTRDSAPSEGRPEERQRMSRRRRTIAARLLEASRETAMLTTFNEVDMGALMDLRRRRRPAIEERHGVRLGITSFFVRAAIGALKAFPRLNAEIDGNEIVLKGYYDIGIAVGVEDGLVVPVIRDADRLSLVETERRIGELAERAKSGDLGIDDLRGGTFTVTNGGVFGSLFSTPILNPPQVGILGLHRIEDRPIAVDGEVVIRPMMYAALSYDHRIVDGREAVQFLALVRRLVESPEELLLEA